MAGAQGFFGVSPDLTIFGKVIAGGYPGAGGLGGKKEYMKYLGAGLDATGEKIKKGVHRRYNDREPRCPAAPVTTPWKKSTRPTLPEGRSDGRPSYQRS